MKQASYARAPQLPCLLSFKSIGITASVALVAFVLLPAFGIPADAQQQESSSDPTKGNAVRLLRLARQEAIVGDNISADRLVQTAMSSLAYDPSSAPALWKEWQSTSLAPDGGELTSIEQAEIFMTAIDNAFLGGPLQPAADALFALRTEVVDQRNAALVAQATALAKEIDALSSRFAKSDASGATLKEIVVEGTLSSGSELLDDCGIVMERARLLPQESLSRLEQACTQLATVIEFAFAAEVQAARKEQASALQLVATSAQVLPAADDQMGPLTIGLEQLIEVVEWRSSLATDELPCADTSGRAASKDAVIADLEELIISAQDSRRLRYESWALSALYDAAESNDWPERLGSIDEQQLSSAVGALHSLILSERLGNVVGMYERVMIVKRHLTKPKCSVERF